MRSDATFGKFSFRLLALASHDEQQQQRRVWKVKAKKQDENWTWKAAANLLMSRKLYVSFFFAYLLRDEFDSQWPQIESFSSDVCNFSLTPRFAC